jgi:hypothetical protein
MAINLSGLSKEDLVATAKNLGMRADWDRRTKEQIASAINSGHSASPEGREKVRQSLYGSTAWSWAQIDSAEGVYLADTTVASDESAPPPEDSIGGSRGDSKAEDSEGEKEAEGEEDSEGEEEAAKKEEEAKEAAKSLAHAIRASEKSAITESMMGGLSGISEVHDPLVSALASFAEQFAAKFAADAAAATEPADPDPIAPPPVTIILKDTDGKVRSEVASKVHKCFPLLLQILATRTQNGNRLNVWLVGPAGTGKTYAAVQAAKILGLPFHGHGSLVARHDAVGFVCATGEYVRTAFRNAWEHGGICLLDEFDGSIPNAVVGINQALSSSVYTFPDNETIPRHPDCAIIAACNTRGGGSTEYVGTFKINDASLDRFVFLNWDIDEDLERGIVDNAAWVKRVQKCRKIVADRGIRSLVTPRATEKGAALLAQGLPQSVVDETCLRMAMSEDQWQTVRDALNSAMVA